MTFPDDVISILIPVSGETCPVCGGPIVAVIITKFAAAYIRDMWNEEGLPIPVTVLCHVVRG
jgi:hypothetical protein